MSIDLACADCLNPCIFYPSNASVLYKLGIGLIEY